MGVLLGPSTVTGLVFSPCPPNPEDLVLVKASRGRTCRSQVCPPLGHYLSGDLQPILYYLPCTLKKHSARFSRPWMVAFLSYKKGGNENWLAQTVSRMVKGFQVGLFILFLPCTRVLFVLFGTTH
jgi:hypothetical protein